MRERDIFTEEEMKLFREVDRETEPEREADVIEPRETTIPIASRQDLNAKHAADWDHYVRSHIKAQWDSVYMPVVADFASEYVTERLSGVMKDLAAEVGQIEKRLRTEITALREELVQARLDIAYLRGASDRDRGGEVIDLPALPSKRAKLNG